MALTSYIESGYENKKKTGVVFIDLTAAYDTVWHNGLMLKLARVIKCKKTLKLLNKMTGTRTFQVVLGNDYSKTKKIQNGVPQGSVLAPTLFNLYISDIPNTQSLKFAYADDLALAYQSNDKNELETTLSNDTQNIHNFFSQWYLKMNTTKTVTTLFHLNNHRANDTMHIRVNNETLPNEKHPKYLGVTLDRALTYKKHLENTAHKVSKRVSLMRKLAGTSWGASQEVLKTTAMALCYSAAEYCSPVWARCAHTSKVDTQLNESMRIVSGTTQSTPIPWLPVMSNIAPPHLRREEATQKQHARLLNSDSPTPLKQVIDEAPVTSRLKSRKPFYKATKENYETKEAWRNEWRQNLPRQGEVIPDPTKPLPGFHHLTRRQWTQANRLLTGHGKTAANLHRWGYQESPMCPACHEAPQDTDHLVLHCPITAIPGATTPSTRPMKSSPPGATA